MDGGTGVFKIRIDSYPAIFLALPLPPSHPKWPEVSRGSIKPHYSYGLLYDFIKPKINSMYSGYGLCCTG